jgi:hypothetical protein
MVCLRNISVDTLHKGDTEDNNNNNVIYMYVHAEISATRRKGRRQHFFLRVTLLITGPQTEGVPWFAPSGKLACTPS